MNDNTYKPTPEELAAERQLMEKVEATMRASREAQQRNEELVRENEQLRQKHIETQTALETEKTVRTQQQEHHMNFVNTLLRIVGVGAVMLGVVWLVQNGYVNISPGQQRVATLDDSAARKSDKEAVKAAIREGLEPTQNAVASLDKRLGDIDKATKDARKDAAEARLIAEDNRGGLQTLATAVGKIARGEKPEVADANNAPATSSTTINTVVNLDNWQYLNVVARAKIFQDACSAKVDWTKIDTMTYQAGFAYVTTKDEAQKLISTCDASAIVKKAPVTTTEANNVDPTANEDAAATPAVLNGNEQTPVQKAACDGPGACRLNIAPSPFAMAPGYGSGYGQPGYGGRRGTPRCPSGMYFEGDRCRTPERQLPLSAYQAGVLQNCPTRIEDRWVPRGTRMVHQQRCAPSL